MKKQTVPRIVDFVRAGMTAGATRLALEAPAVDAAMPREKNVCMTYPYSK